MDPTISPAWGSLPLERWILPKLASSIPTNLDQCLRQLALRFVQLGDAGRAHELLNADGQISELIPSPSWEHILSPLRNDFQRLLASPSSFNQDGFEGFGVIWLRTSYDNDDAHEKLLEGLNAEVALDYDQNILDDRELYDFGDDWARIFQLIPERLFCLTADYEGHLTASTQRAARIQSVKMEFDNGRFNEHALVRASQRELPGENRFLTDDEVRANIYRAKTQDLHKAVTVNYLFVADRIAMQTGSPRIIFFDDYGRVVRHARIEPQLCEDFAGGWAGGLLSEMLEFKEGEVGSDYMPGGICGPPYSI